MQAKYTHQNFEFTFTDDDIVNKDDFIPAGEYNPHKVRPWLLHDHGVTICVVFASSLQEALDEAVDADKLDRYQLDLEEVSTREDYMQNEPSAGYDPNVPEFVDESGVKWWWQEGREPAFLGNASEPFDIESLQVIELPNPRFSFVALFNAREE